MRHQHLKSTFIVSAVLCLGLSSNVYALEPFKADYQFQYNGKTLGSASRTLTQSGQQWNYVFSASAAGLASATETSKFKFKDGKILSDYFTRKSKVLVRSDSLKIDFNAAAKTINTHTSKNDTKRNFAWVNGALDDLNAELQIREDLKNNQLRAKYYITDAQEVESRKFVKAAGETIKTPAGTYDTVKVILKHDKPGRETIFWMAPKLDYLPVKISHVDKKSSYGLMLKSYKGPTN